MANSPLLETRRGTKQFQAHKVSLLACKQASSHWHELTPKQCVSYNLASADGVYVKQDDIYQGARHDHRSRLLHPWGGDMFPLTA
jgi:hypothetical protein